MKIHVPLFEQAKVMVIGDVMLDRYWHGGTQRISPEAPVPVVHVKEIEERPGGAGNVALNVAALGTIPLLIGILGDDEAANVLEQKLTAVKVQCHLQREKNIPTITKLRVISLNQQLIRLDFEQPISASGQSKLLDDYLTYLTECQAVILSDYHKGTLQEPQALIMAAQNLKIPVFVDPKGASFHQYQGAYLLKPNRKEFETIVGVCKTEQDFIEKGSNALQIHNLQALLITRGAEGMLLLEKGQPPFYLPAHAEEVYDVTGAGDTVIAVLASATAAGSNLKSAVTLANLAASIVVKKLGAATTTQHELRRALRQHQIVDDPHDENETLLAIRDAQAHQEKIVMTNGCFDILHPGHIAYLEQAKALGDRLVVAVNDDNSVRRLKGNYRPINSLAHRMAVLAGLQSVDWVVSFSEDTPANLIEKINPNVLVKGGDYQIDQIAGAEFVLANGGEVKTLCFIDNYSTSKIIKTILGEPA